MERARVLILTASIGSGHTRAAEAIRAALEAHPQADAMQVDVVDFMAREVSIIHYLMKRIYLTMLRFVPDLYDVFFRIAGKNASGGIVRGAFAQVMVRTVGRIIQTYDPHLIVATHPFPEGAAALWRARHGGSFALTALLTDYAVHAIWLTRNVDMYFVATEKMAEDMRSRGFDACTVRATGIPIAPADYALERRAAQERIGLSEELPTLLLMGGGLGLGGMDRTVAALEQVKQKLTILVVAGHNSALVAHARTAAQTSRHMIILMRCLYSCVPQTSSLQNLGRLRSVRRLLRSCRCSCMTLSQDLKQRMRFMQHGVGRQCGCIQGSIWLLLWRRF